MKITLERHDTGGFRTVQATVDHPTKEGHRLTVVLQNPSGALSTDDVFRAVEEMLK